MGGKVFPVHAINLRRGLEKQLPSLTISALTICEISNSLASYLTYGEERPATHYTGYSVVLKGSLEVLEKHILESAGNRTRIPKSYYAIPGSSLTNYFLFSLVSLYNSHTSHVSMPAI
jgi:hypothetical protein